MAESYNGKPRRLTAERTLFMKEQMALTPSQLLDYCIVKLSRIPYNMETEATVGNTVKEVSSLLEQLKKVIITAENDDV